MENKRSKYNHQNCLTQYIFQKSNISITNRKKINLKSEKILNNSTSKNYCYHIKNKKNIFYD